MSKSQSGSPWSLHLSTASLVLIPAAIGINYVGKLFASMLKLPLWLDSIGTCLSACLAGPIVGALAGFLTNVIYGLTMDPISTVYGITQAGIGIVVGLMAWHGRLQKWPGILLTGLLAGLVAIVISTPLNIIFWGGSTGNVWGDAVFAAMGSQGFLASAVDELIVDLPDKIVVLFIVAGIYKVLPRSLVTLYQAKDETFDD
ncbi:MAG: ECF transporter S component [Coriobacteriales bacterium]|nr:ECF transporter S component [Coriobacteriales bacterium]